MGKKRDFNIFQVMLQTTVSDVEKLREFIKSISDLTELLGEVLQTKGNYTRKRPGTSKMKEEQQKYIY